MKIDYPTLVSKFVLFLGAGLSVRNVFRKLGEDYLKQRGEGGEKRYVYEEILLVCHELDSGISEASAYAHFGARCRSRQYTKFCSLLSQNADSFFSSPALQASLTALICSIKSVSVHFLEKFNRP